jgi:hypothetical protein
MTNTLDPYEGQCGTVFVFEKGQIGASRQNIHWGVYSCLWQDSQNKRSSKETHISLSHRDSTLLFSNNTRWQKIFNHRSTIRANCEICKIVLLPHSRRVKYTFGSNKTQQYLFMVFYSSILTRTCRSASRTMTYIPLISCNVTCEYYAQTF